METLADRLARLHVHATLADGRIGAELAGGQDLRLTFNAGYFRSVDEWQLGRDLTDLLDQLWTAQQAEVRHTITQAGGQVLTRQHATTDTDREYHDRLDRLIFRGSAEHVRIAARDPGGWSVTVSPGALRELHQPDLVAETAAAVRELLTDRQRQIRATRVQVYYQGRR